MHKNHLGQISIVCSVLGLIIFVHEQKNFRKLIAFGIFFLSVLLGIGTLSSTTYTALFVFLSITLLYYIKKQIFSRIGAGNILFFTTIFMGLFLLAVFLIFAPEILDKFQALFGKEGSFEDRGRLWQYIMWSIAEHPILGCGFQGFWVQGTPAVELLYSSFLWLPIQGHNGYLDILNEMGIVGMLLFIIVLLNYFRFAFLKKKFNLWSWFIVLPLVVNITETTFFRAGHTSNVFFLMSYLIMFSSLNENSQDSLNEK